MIAAIIDPHWFSFASPSKTTLLIESNRLVISHEHMHMKTLMPLLKNFHYSIANALSLVICMNEQMWIVDNEKSI